VAAAATGKLPAAGLRKTPPFKQQQQQQQQQQQHAEAGQPAAAAAAAADVSTTQAAGVLAGGQLPLVGREDELFQAALEAMPPKEAQSLVQVCTSVLHCFMSFASVQRQPTAPLFSMLFTCSCHGIPAT
jgi:hypothetical protein